SATLMPHLSPELRQRIVVWHYEQHRPAAEIAQLAGCCIRTVYDVLVFQRDYGQTTNPFSRPRGGSRTLSTGDINYIASVLQAHPKIYLDELQQRLLESRGIE
ncbi:hypothetical protein B0H13DRAFT_1560938, partial [Mycena leptocephala]